MFEDLHHKSFISTCCSITGNITMQEGYADAFVPVIKNTIAAASSKKAKNSQNQKANLAREVERRKKIIDKMKKMAEQEAIFKVGHCYYYS